MWAFYFWLDCLDPNYLLFQERDVPESGIYSSGPIPRRSSRKSTRLKW